MAPNNNQVRDYVRSNAGRVFSLHEAIEFQKGLDNLPTGTDINIRWVDAKTKKPVAIGYNR